METQVQFSDVTGILVHFSHEQINSLVHAMTPEQRRFARGLADTIQHPHEIWQAWVADEHNAGQWFNTRFYLQFLDLSQTDVGEPYGVAVVRFVFEAARSRLELAEMHTVFGIQERVEAQINGTVRRGHRAYSIA